jgi:serine/threonine-protein kinase PknG
MESGKHHGDGIPRLKVDRDDGAANIIVAAGAVGDHDRRVLMFERALKAHPESVELRLRMIDELVSLGRFDEGESRLAAVQKDHPTDWRLAWYRGRALLAQGKVQRALEAFHAIVDELPGELGPKQALGRAYEASGALDRAITYYDAVSRADPSFTTASLALARCLEKRGDKNGAADAYRRVPTTSNRYANAQMALARLLIMGDPTPDDVLQASAAVQSLDGMVDGLDAHKLRAEVLRAGATLATDAVAVLPKEPVLGVAFAAGALKRAAEHELRVCARMASNDDERVHFVDEANAVRPVTLV